MTVYTWPNTVNYKFYNYQEAPKKNTTTSEMVSGRVVAYQNNTKYLKKITCSLLLDVTDELPEFWHWYNDVLGQAAGVFTCAGLGVNKYRFTAVPAQNDTDRDKTALSLEIEEV